VTEQEPADERAQAKGENDTLPLPAVWNHVTVWPVTDVELWVSVAVQVVEE
jgi:hypothetical protein